MRLVGPCADRKIIPLVKELPVYPDIGGFPKVRHRIDWLLEGFHPTEFPAAQA
jgi:hypothetical protein